MNKTRSQEFQKLQKLARKLDIDYQEWDYQVQSYDEIKRSMLKKAGMQTPQIVQEVADEWQSIAEYYDNLSIEERTYIPSDSTVKIELVNVLVLKFHPRMFGFAKDVLIAKFKGNIMDRTWRILEANKQLHPPIRILMLMGQRRSTDMMLEELEKHNIRPQIIRNSYLRRDFLHYLNGRFYPMSKRQFREATEPQSVLAIKEEEKLLASLR